MAELFSKMLCNFTLLEYNRGHVNEKLMERRKNVWHGIGLESARDAQI